MKNREESGSTDKRARPDPARRAFLVGATSTVAASGIAAATLGRVGGSEPPRNNASPQELSYRETDHIRTFYARSRF